MAPSTCLRILIVTLTSCIWLIVKSLLHSLASSLLPRSCMLRTLGPRSSYSDGASANQLSISFVALAHILSTGGPRPR
eukprot:6940289-Pyramimonas_sp.AAC.1